MTLYEATKGQTRPVHLEQLYRALKSIKPSSIDPERAFSAMGYFCTKIRSRMGDDVLDAIIFMQQYYKNNESNSQKNLDPRQLQEIETLILMWSNVPLEIQEPRLQKPLKQAGLVLEFPDPSLVEDQCSRLHRQTILFLHFGAEQQMQIKPFQLTQL